MSSLQRRFGLPTDLTPFICHTLILIAHLSSFIRATCPAHFRFVLVTYWTMSVTLVLCLMIVTIVTMDYACHSGSLSDNCYHFYHGLCLSLWFFAWWLLPFLPWTMFVTLVLCLIIVTIFTMDYVCHSGSCLIIVTIFTMHYVCRSGSLPDDCYIFTMHYACHSGSLPDDCYIFTMDYVCHSGSLPDDCYHFYHGLCLSLWFFAW